MNNLTEMYSAIKAEVPVDDDVSTKHNTALLTQLANTQKVMPFLSVFILHFPLSLLKLIHYMILFYAILCYAM